MCEINLVFHYQKNVKNFENIRKNLQIDKIVECHTGHLHDFIVL